MFGLLIASLRCLSSAVVSAHTSIPSAGTLLSILWRLVSVAISGEYRSLPTGLPRVSYSCAPTGKASVLFRFSPLDALPVFVIVWNSAHGIIRCPDGAISPWKHLVPGGRCCDRL